MATILALIFIVVLVIILLLNLISLPANWIMLACIFLWAFLGPIAIPTTTLAIVTAFALMGEICEFAFKLWGSKKYGSSSQGTWGGILGSFLGAILLSPLFFGLGAVLGALIGAFAGTLFIEKMRGMHTEQAVTAAKGAIFGTFLGMIIKFGFGVAMINFVVQALFMVETSVITL